MKYAVVDVKQFNRLSRIVEISTFILFLIGLYVTWTLLVH
jgi:hypothetical protein